MYNLSEQELRKIAPSIFTETSIEGVSKIYKHVNTFKIIKDLEKLNWLPVKVQEVKSRTKQGYQKHMVSFQNPNIQFSNEKNEIPQILVTNSHDATNAFKFMYGVYRLICCNGLISGNVLANMRIIHKKYNMQEVENQVSKYIKEVPNIQDKMERMKEIKMVETDSLSFAKLALNLRYKKVELSPIQPIDLLGVRRSEDKGNTLWNNFNVIQENLIKGGLSGSTIDGKKMTTKRLNGIDTTLKINKGLWDIAEQYIS